MLMAMQPAFNGAAKIATTPAPQPYTQMSRWMIFFFVYSVPLAFVRAFDAAGDAYIPAVVFADALLAFGYCAPPLVMLPVHMCTAHVRCAWCACTWALHMRAGCRARIKSCSRWLLSWLLSQHDVSLPSSSH